MNISTSNRSDTPFIIWTLQRTGGTNLAHRLCERSSLPGAQHEPFNRDRAYGYVTTAWARNQDHAELKAEIKRIVDSQSLIKHCVENVPMPLSEELARASCAAGYKHLFLYRQQPLGRLLSLHFARSTDIWGPEISDKTAYDDNVFSSRLPVKDLVAREERCSNRLRILWSMLKQLGGRPVAFSFEQLYASDDLKATWRAIRGLLNYLDLSRDEASDEKFIQEVLYRGDQGTRKKYGQFHGIEDLRHQLEDVEIFDPKQVQLDVIVAESPTPAQDVRYALIDTKPAKVAEGETYGIEGVVVLDEGQASDCSLILRFRSSFDTVRWGIRSAKMAQLFPDATNSGNARFQIMNLVAAPGSQYEVCLVHESGEAEELFRIRTDPLSEI